MRYSSLQRYYRDEVNDSANENNDGNNYRINDNKTITSKYFEHLTKVIENTPDNENRLYAEVVVPLKYLSNCWSALEIEYDLSWSR